ncbi:hypothetical protein MPH47_09715, partial [Psychrobacillus psychrodurans]|uniref:hypothetical protein n=1 Tax=Psychrobacillus psychrodurans TaxID=126157 RepID=UPI001F4D7CFA
MVQRKKNRDNLPTVSIPILMKFTWLVVEVRISSPSFFHPNSILYKPYHAYLSGLDSGFIWVLSGFYLGFIWVLSGFYLGFIWVLSGFYLGFIWVLSGFYLG